MININIIYDDENYLVINKPAGLAVHPAPSIKTETLVDWLLANYPTIKNVGEDLTRPGIVHRLDREVSGLMVVAKTQTAFLNLKHQFQERSVIKEYLALAYGLIETAEGEINFPLKRSAKGFKMAAVPINYAGDGEIIRDALTIFTTLAKNRSYTLLEVQIKTGRTHQIRAHFLALGHPLVGDNLYSTRVTRIKNLKLHTDRVLLFSKRLEFTALTGEKLKFELSINDLKQEIAAMGVKLP